MRLLSKLKAKAEVKARSRFDTYVGNTPTVLEDQTLCDGTSFSDGRRPEAMLRYGDEADVAGA